MKKSLIVLVIFFLVVYGDLEISHFFSQKRKSELNSVILHGLAFYSPEKIKDLSVDSYFLLKQISKHLDGKYAFANENTYNNPFARLLDKENYLKVNFSRTDHSYQINPEYQSALTDPWDSILMKALYCDLNGYDKADFSILETLNHYNGSYWDTHFLLGLLFLKNNGCYDPNQIEQSIAQASSQIIDAENNDKSFSDLYVERTVLLYWSGYGQNVRSGWIDVIKNNFIEQDPGWRAGDSYLGPNPHTTGLALLSMIYYLEEKPEQTFYR